LRLNTATLFPEVGSILALTTKLIDLRRWSRTEGVDPMPQRAGYGGGWVFAIVGAVLMALLIWGTGTGGK
jgi:hypothetical protein